MGCIHTRRPLRRTSPTTSAQDPEPGGCQAPDPLQQLRPAGPQIGAHQGWPSWLVAVAGDSIGDFVPRRADSFQKLDKIGEGTYSNVYKARDLMSGKIVALKKVRFDNLEAESVKFMAREILVLTRLDHPNVIKLQGLVTSRMSSGLYLAFDYMEHDLSGIAARQHGKFTEPQVKCYMKQLLLGLEHCHIRDVLHRDIKCSNLLISNEGNLKIADFGLATFYDPERKQAMTNRVVTLWYRAPELLLGATNYGVGIDLWSAGCILAELLHGKPILPGRTEVEQLHMIFRLCGSPSEAYWNKYKLSKAKLFMSPQPYNCCIAETFKDLPPSALPLLETLLSIDPEDRGTATAALNSEFFAAEPYACEPSNLPKYPPSKEMDLRLINSKARRDLNKRADGIHRPRRDGVCSGVGQTIPASGANAENRANLERPRLVKKYNAGIKSQKFPPAHLDGEVGTSTKMAQNGDGINRVHQTTSKSVGSTSDGTSSTRKKMSKMSSK